jgi:hypothetical protein
MKGLVMTTNGHTQAGSQTHNADAAYNVISGSLRPTLDLGDLGANGMVHLRRFADSLLIQTDDGDDSGHARREFAPRLSEFQDLEVSIDGSIEFRVPLTAVDFGTRA